MILEAFECNVYHHKERSDVMIPIELGREIEERYRRYLGITLRVREGNLRICEVQGSKVISIRRWR